MNDIATLEGEVSSDTVSDFSSLPALVRAEIDVQIATARKYPRVIANVRNNITELATLDEQTAEECLYVLVRQQKKKGRGNNQPADDDRDNKPIEGPSIRLAEIAVQVYGNCRTSARVTEVNRKEMYVEAEGVFHDLQTNSAQRKTVRRRISTKGGYLFSDDMIVVTGNAACAIAIRNAILAGIPRALYRPAYEAARAMIAGTQQTLVQNRDKAFKVWETKGITAAQLLEKLDLETVDQITPEHIAQLRGLWATIKNGEATVEEVFSSKPAPSHEKIENALSDGGQAEQGVGDGLAGDATTSSDATAAGPAEPSLEGVSEETLIAEAAAAGAAQKRAGEKRKMPAKFAGSEAASAAFVEAYEAASDFPGDR